MIPVASTIVSDSSFNFSWDVSRPNSLVEVFLFTERAPSVIRGVSQLYC